MTANIIDEKDVSDHAGVLRQTEVRGRDGRHWVVSTVHLSTTQAASPAGAFARLVDVMVVPPSLDEYETMVFSAEDWETGDLPDYHVQHASTEEDARSNHDSIIERLDQDEIMLRKNYAMRLAGVIDWDEDDE